MDRPMTVPALRLVGLKKSYGPKEAVRGIDLRIEPGVFYGLLGPNGAGKTTTLKMVTGLLQPSSGTIEVFGVDIAKDPVAAKRIMAWLPDEPMLYDKLTPLEYLSFVANLWQMQAGVASAEAEDLLRRLELWENRNDRCETFSRGMKQKLALAGALLHQPKLLVLDEPLTGLDAAISRLVKDILLDKARQGCTIILTTHFMEVAERLVDRIGIIQGGLLLADDTLEGLRQRTGRAGGALEDVFLDLIDGKGAVIPAAEIDA
jgi:ABC-2 type transport system ATP-binding protein